MATAPKIGTATRSVAPGSTYDQLIRIPLGTVDADATHKFLYYADAASRLIDAWLISDDDLAVDGTDFLTVTLQNVDLSTPATPSSSAVCSVVPTTEDGADGEAAIAANTAWSLNVDQNQELAIGDALELDVAEDGTVSITDVVLFLIVRRPL